MNNHMNIFIPYEKNNEHHEDHLTRSFLILLKYSSAVFYMFYNYISEECYKEQIYLANLYNEELKYNITTQIGCEKAINYTNNNILSILITDRTENLNIKSNVHCSDRTAIYDGVISINENWTFILENKPFSGNVWENQLSVGLKLGEYIKDKNLNLISKPIILTWREIFKRLANLECSSIEKLLIGDFLDFVFNNYPEMFPYEKFKQCKSNRHLLDLRIEKLLKNIVSDTNKERVDHHSNWAYTIRYETMYINQIDYRPVLENSCISIYFCFGLNVPKSKNFFSNINIAKLSNMDEYHKFLNIRITDSRGRTVYAIDCVQGLENEFIQYWKDNIQDIRQYDTSDILSEIEKKYLQLEFIKKFNIDDLKEKIGNRTVLRILPVLDMEYCIDFETIYRLEVKGQLEQEFVNKTIEGLKFVGDDKDFISLLNSKYQSNLVSV